MGKAPTATTTDTQTISAPAARRVEYAGKIVNKSLGNPKLIATLSDTETHMWFGKVFGQATKIVQRTGPDGEIYEGLGGSFEAAPDDVNKPIIRAGIIYFPESLFTMITEQLLDDAGQVKAPMEFAFRVGVKKDSNAQGYTWIYEPLVDMAAHDPLAALRSQVVGNVALIEPPKS